MTSERSHELPNRSSKVNVNFDFYVFAISLIAFEMSADPRIEDLSSALALLWEAAEPEGQKSASGPDRNSVLLNNEDAPTYLTVFYLML